MKEIVTWAVTIWDMYWGNGWVQYLLALSGIGILILGRKKGIALRLFFYTVLLLGLFFCPVSGRVIMRCIGESVYWRVLWLLPTVPVIAGGFTEVVSRSKNGILQAVLTAVLVGAVIISGTGMIKAGNFERVYNHRQVPDEIAMICNKINADRNKREVRIAADEYAASYIRVYDPSLKMVYGRRGYGAADKTIKNLYKQITSEIPDGKTVSDLANTAECTYVVMVPPNEKFLQDMENGGYRILDTVDLYYIFVCEQYR